MRKIYCASLLFVVFMITSCKVLFDLNETPVDVTYTVKYYLQNVENDNYTFYESVQRKGKTGESVAEETREFEGFSKVSQETTTIESSIPIIVKVKYDRNYYIVNFYSDENADSSFIRSDNLKYESKINYPANPEKEGFEFIGWSEKVEKVPSHDVKIFATWKAIETEDPEPEPEPEPEPVLPKDISCTVNYFEENIDDDNFTLVKTETLTGKEGDLTEVSPESKEGFADAVYKNVTLSDEENIVIDVKYSRKSILYIFILKIKFIIRLAENMNLK